MGAGTRGSDFFLKTVVPSCSFGKYVGVVRLNLLYLRSYGFEKIMGARIEKKLYLEFDVASIGWPSRNAAAFLREIYLLNGK